MGTYFLGLVGELRKGCMVAACGRAWKNRRIPWVGQMGKYMEGEQGRPRDACTGGVQGVARLIKDARAVSGRNQMGLSWGGPPSQLAPLQASFCRQ